MSINHSSYILDDKLRIVEESDENGNSVTCIEGLDEKYVYELPGKAMLTKLDENNFLFHSYFEDISHVVLINTQWEIPIVMLSYSIKSTTPFIFTKELKDAKSIVINDIHKYIYSYEFGIRTTGFYDELFVHEDGITANLHTKNDIYRGELQFDGQLVGDELHSTNNNGSFIIEQFDPEYFIKKQERKEEKQRTRKAYANWEYSHYLATQKKKNK